MNVARGLTVLSGKADKFLALMKRFVETHADDVTRLAAALDSGDTAAARRLAHTLKGTGATLGADLLAAQAESLEGVLRANPDGGLRVEEIRPELEAIRQALAALAAALPSPPDLSTPDAPMPVNQDELQAVLNDLDELLEQSDMAAIGLFTQHTALLHSALGLPCIELERQLKRFDFEAAQETLRRLH
jgi:HPt (histidine-containing phosphotransfer) domain-containing protein